MATNPPSKATFSNQILAAFSAADHKLFDGHLRNATHKQGAILLEQDEHIDHVYFPYDGMVSLVTVLEDGRSIELAAVGREGVVGPGLANGTGSSPSRAVMQVAGKGSWIEARRFYAAVDQSASLRQIMNYYAEALMAQVVRTVACNVSHPVEARMSRWLLMVHDRVGGDRLELTQEFLGQMLGVQRTTVTLTARALQNAGLIRYRRGRIDILDRAGLEETACECYQINRRHFDRLMSLAQS